MVDTYGCSHGSDGSIFTWDSGSGSGGVFATERPVVDNDSALTTAYDSSVSFIGAYHKIQSAAVFIDKSGFMTAT